MPRRSEAAAPLQAIVVAGTHSGVGKTSIDAGAMARSAAALIHG